MDRTWRAYDYQASYVTTENESQQQRPAGYNVEIDRGAKQRYLVREIIDKGYGQEEFGAFLREKKNSLHGVNALNVE